VTAYSNFVQDFPSRCIDILQDYESSATLKGREVTLSISIATSAFIFPFERLRPTADDHIAPDRNQESISAMRELLKRSFESWADGQAWAFNPRIPGPELRASIHVEQWLITNPPNPLRPSQNVEEILSLLRNALAHGNIYSYPTMSSTAIEKLLFLSKRRDPESGNLIDEYKLLQGSPQDFVSLVRNWVQFLSEIDIPTSTSEPVSFAIPMLEEAGL